MTSRGWRVLGGLALAVGADRWAAGSTWVAVLFHHVTDGRRWRADDPFVKGLGIDTPIEVFTDRIEFLARHYDIVGLDAVVRTDPQPRRRRRRLLICFDDAYASVAQLAAPALARLGLPWCFFVNPSHVGNSSLALDNFVAYVANTVGLDALGRAVGRPVDSVGAVLRGALADYGPSARRSFQDDLAAQFGLQPVALARQARLYLEPEDLRSLAEAGVEIGNHTADHASCRALDEVDAEDQVAASARRIALLTGRPVRGFAYPYGSPVDATPLVDRCVRASGHACAFVVQGRHNDVRTDPYLLYRISLTGTEDAQTSLELSVLPRLRALRARARGDGR